MPRPQTIVTATQKQTYFACLLQGMGYGAAATMAGITPGVLRRLRRDDEEFIEAEAATEMLAASPIEDKLHQAALNGEPWAIKMWLERRVPERWAPNSTSTVKHEMSGTIQVTAGQAEMEIAKLQEKLLERRAAALELDSIPEAEIVA